MMQERRFQLLPIGFSGGYGVDLVEGCHGATNHIGINGSD
jgi:hypothetical protein